MAADQCQPVYHFSEGIHVFVPGKGHRLKHYQINLTTMNQMKENRAQHITLIPPPQYYQGLPASRLHV